MRFIREEESKKAKANTRCFLFVIAGFFCIFCLSFSALGQSCNYADKGNFMKFSKGCAPIDPEWEIRYAGLELPVKVVVDWGDGTLDRIDATSPNFQETFTHTYQKDEGVCTYRVIAYVEANGVPCGETEQEQKITVWDTDNPADGKLSIDPFVFRVCYGNAANINFVDNSQWNCMDPNETATPNDAPRWIQWEYGTGNPLNRIPGVEVNGSTHTYPFKNNPPVYPVTSAGQISDNIYVPSTTTIADVGKEFVVTLRNWNQCNPYDVNLADGAFNPLNGDLNNGDSAFVYTTARIIIVDSPKPQFTIREGSYGGSESSQFCPGETVFFNNSTPNGYSYEWSFEVPLGADPIANITGKNISTKDFTYPGIYKATLTVTDNNVAGSCIAKLTKDIEIIKAPTPKMEISVDEGAGMNITTNVDFCEMVGDAYDFSIANQTTVPTGATPEYTWRLLRLSDNSVIQTETTIDINELFEFSLGQPGAYRVSLTAMDLLTGCDNPVEQIINIYNAPEADFEIVGSTELCVGRQSEFNDLSKLVSPKGFADDEIVSWEWWFDYNGDPNSASDSPDEDPTWVFTQARNYDVRLLVETKYGCVDDIIVTITVNPVANAVITVDQPQNCAPHEPTFTNVDANDQPPLIDVERYKWYIYSGGVLVDTLSQYPDGTNVFVDTMAYEFLYTQTDNLDQLYKVYMEAYAIGGCVSTSDTIDITIFPTASARFTSDYDPLGSNCTPVNVKFEVDLATKNLPFAKDFSWTVVDSEGTAIFGPTTADPGAEIFSYSFTNPDSIAIKNYEVTLNVTSSNGPCLQPYTQQIKVNPTPSSKFTVVETKQCDIVTLAFDANQKGLGTSNYYWTFTETSTGAPKSYQNSPVLDDNFALQFERSADADSVVEVTLRTRNFAGCESTGPSFLYTIPRLDQFDVEFDTVSVMPKCYPQEITFDNISAVPAGTTYELKVQKGSSPAFIVPAANISGDITSTFAYTLTEAGEYVVTLTGTHANGCTDNASRNITVNPSVEAIFTPSATLVCPGDPVYLNEASTPKAIIAHKNWTITDLDDNKIVATLFGSQLFYVFDSSGHYEIKLEVISNNQCSDITTHNITVLAPPEFTLDFEDSSCDQTFYFDITAVDPTITITKYVWVWGDGKIIETVNPDTSHLYLNRNGFMGPDQYNGTVTATSSTGCTYSHEFTVNLKQDVEAGFLMDKDKGCGPLTVVFDDVSLGTDFSGQEWHYREVLPTTGPWISFDGINHTFENTGTVHKEYEVRLKAKNIAGDCFDPQTKTVIVYPEINADFSFVDSDQCSPYEVVFTNNSNALTNPNVTYTWAWGDGTDEVVSSDASVSHIFQNSSFSVSRNFKVRLTAIDGTSNCSSFIEKTVTVKPTLRAEIEPSDTLGCAPFTVEFSNETNGIPSNGHNWWVLNTNTNQIDPAYTGIFQNFSATFENKTFDTIRYKVIYEGTSSAGCTISDSAFVLVYPEISPSFTVTPSEQNLPSSTVTINNTTFDNPSYNYEWDFGNGFTSTEKNPAPYTYGTYGVFTITLTVTDQFTNDAGEAMCPKVFSQTVTINPTIPIIDFEYNPADGCGPLTVQFTNKSKFVDLKTLVWDFGDNSASLSSDENPTYTYYEPGEYTVTLSGSNEIGITVTETKKYIINVYDNPRANFRVYQRMPVYIPDSVVFFNESEGAVSYHWDFGDGTTSTKFEPKHAYTQPGNYVITLIATNAEGCADTLRRDGEISIEGKFEVKIPNVFTPNGDLDNEVFLPLMQGVVEYNLMIYNRWGELLFESNNQEVGWDGYYKGVLSPPDVYIYKLDLKFTNGERTSKFGDVTLLR